MQSTVDLFAGSRLLQAISNGIALATALFFIFKITQFVRGITKQVHQTKLKPFLAAYKSYRIRNATIAAQDAHFFLAYVVSRGCILITASLGLIAGLIANQADRNEHGPLWKHISADGLFDFDVIVRVLSALSGAFILLVFTAILFGLLNFSLRVQRGRRRRWWLARRKEK